MRDRERTCRRLATLFFTTTIRGLGIGVFTARQQESVNIVGLGIEPRLGQSGPSANLHGCSD